MYKEIILTIIATATIYILRSRTGIETANKAILLALIVYGLYQGIRFGIKYYNEKKKK